MKHAAAKSPAKPPRHAVAALTFEVTAGGHEVQLIPDGVFHARDGRPQPWGGWKLTPEIAARLVAEAAARANDYVIDYEHQTQLADKNGLPAPAAAWFKQLEYRPGKGLYATDVRWTPRALDYIKAQEYRYISAVFTFDKDSGAVGQLICAALTNNPALDGMDEVALAALTAHFIKADAATAHASGGPSSEKSTMNPVLLALLKALGLAETATEVEAVSAVAALKAKAESVDGLTTQIATLKSATPDPAKYVAIEKLNELNTQIVTLKAADAERQVEEVIAKAKAEGRLVPAVEEVWRAVGKSDLAQLKKLVEATPANPALAGQSQTEGKEPGAKDTAKLDEAQLAICKSMGLTPEQFLAGAAAA